MIVENKACIRFVPHSSPVAANARETMPCTKPSDGRVKVSFERALLLLLLLLRLSSLASCFVYEKFHRFPHQCHPLHSVTQNLM